MSEYEYLVRNSFPNNMRNGTIIIRAIGAPGAAGGGGGQNGFDFVQASPSSTWTINHNLGRKPIVELLSVGGQEMDASVLHTSNNQTVVTFNMAVAGTARLI